MKIKNFKYFAKRLAKEIGTKIKRIECGKNAVWLDNGYYMELDDDMIIVYGNPQNLYQIKDAITSKLSGVEFDIDEISYIPKEKITLNADDKVIFERILTLLDDVEDVQNVYHNVEM